MNESKFKLKLRIDWSEIDGLGHINNLAIMKYIQAGRVNYLESVGLLPIKPENRTGPIIASITCQFRKPLFYPGNVTVFLKVDLVKNTSFRIQYEVLNDDAEVVAEAHDIIVFYDFDKNTKLVLPEELKKKITSGI